jgi:hypothetical protein
MKQINVLVDEKVGIIADISYILGKAKVNIEAISVGVIGNKAVISLTIKDDKRAKELLEANHYKVLSSDVLAVKIPDQPGGLAQITKLLVDNGIGIINVHVITKGGGNVLLAIQVDKQAKAEKVLAGYIIRDTESIS